MLFCCRLIIKEKIIFNVVFWFIGEVLDGEDYEDNDDDEEGDDEDEDEDEDDDEEDDDEEV